ncbi:MAG TPA: RDD family protein [Streptosporangiaceae bacterium]
MSADTDAVGWVSSQGHYAGSVSRFAAYVIDLAVSAGLFALGLAGTSLVAQVVTRHQVSWNRTNIVVAVIFVAWEFFYFGYSWAMSGRTFGMAVLGVQVVRADGQVLDPWRGALRALVFPLSFLLLGAGFLGILVQREHRALHDLIAGTAVIYAWDARAARLRFLARQADIGATSSSRRGAATAIPDPRDPGPGLAEERVRADVPVPSAAGEASRASSGDR